MSKINSKLSAIRRVTLGALLLAGSLSGAACGSSPWTVVCEGGRTSVDGVCADNSVADYVACVRAQGAQLDASRRQGLTAELGYLQARVGGAAELSESLTKKYSTTDAATLAIVKACNHAAGFDSDPTQKPSMRGTWAGTATEQGETVPVRLKVDNQGPGRCAMLLYPTLGCMSVLHCEEPLADGSIRGVEQIVEGQRCANGGRITLAHQPNGTVSFLWRGNPNHNVATGTLHPDRMP